MELSPAIVAVSFTHPLYPSLAAVATMLHRLLAPHRRRFRYLAHARDAPAVTFRELVAGRVDDPRGAFLHRAYALAVDGQVYDAAMWALGDGGRAFDVATMPTGDWIGTVHQDADGTHWTRTRAGGRTSQRRRRWDLMRAAFAAWPAP